MTRSRLDKACGLIRAFNSLWHKKKSVHLRGTIVVIGLMVEFVGELNVTEAGTGRYVEHAITIVSCHAADIPCLSRIDTLLLRFVVWSCSGLATLVPQMDRAILPVILGPISIIIEPFVSD